MRNFMLICAAVIVTAGCEPVSVFEESSLNEPGAPAAAAQEQTEQPPAAQQQSSASDAFDFSRTAWIGPNFSGSQRDGRAALHSIDVDPSSNTIRLAYDPLPSDWPKQVNAPGMLCLFEQLGDGSWRGGKFEWLDPGQTVKTLKNIDNGYNGWRRPATGSRVALIIFSTDGARMSNPAYTTYD